MSPRELERLHLLATLKEYAPQSSSFIRERANDEAAHDAFDPIPPITAGGIAPKLIGLRSAGLVAYFADDETWDITLEGARVLEAGLNELDGHVSPPAREDAAWVLERYQEAKEILDDLNAFGASYNLPDDLRETILEWHNATLLDGCTTLGPDCACNKPRGLSRQDGAA